MGGQTRYLFPDRLQAALLVLCAADLAYFVFYLLAYSLQEEHTISDSLFTNPAYATILSVTLSFRMLGVVFFLYQYRNEPDAMRWWGPGFLAVFLTLFGW
jgi:hypothetical protein